MVQKRVTGLAETTTLDAADVVLVERVGSNVTRKATVSTLAAAALARVGGASITPATISTQQNDYEPAGAADASIWRLSAASPGHTITGIAGGVAGRLLIVENVGSFPILLKEESGASADGNRFALGPNGGNPALEAGMVWLVVYDATLTRWVIIGLGKNATTTAPGLMSHTDKTKLDGIAASAAALGSSEPAFVNGSAGTAGVATVAAREDHRHEVATAGPVAVGTANADGAAPTLAKSDHVHDLPIATLTAKGAVLTSRAIATGAGLSGGGDLSADRSLAVVFGVSGEILSIGTENDPGVLDKAARADHLHQHDVQDDPTLHAAATRLAAGFMGALDKDERWERLTRLVVQSDMFTVGAPDIYNAAVSGAGAANALSTGTSTAGGSIAGHAGMIQSTTGSTSTGRAGFWALFSASASQFRFSGGMRMGWLFKLDQLSSGSEEFTLRFGVGDSISAEPNDGLYFVYDRTVSTNWLGKSAASSSRSTASGGSNVAVATGWHYAELRVNSAATQVDFYMDGTLIGSVTTNLPTTTNNFFPGMWQLIKSVGTTPVTAVLDAVAFGQDFASARA